jgi:hypothetical protein
MGAADKGMVLAGTVAQTMLCPIESASALSIRQHAIFIFILYFKHHRAGSISGASS